MKVILGSFDKTGFHETARRRGMRSVNGVSCVVDWHKERSKASAWLEGVADKVAVALPNGFQKQVHLHSTILSIELDHVDLLSINDGGRVASRKWHDSKYQACDSYFGHGLHTGFELDAELAVVSGAGTIQIVLRNESHMPAIRGYLVSQGAQVKPGTIDGDFLYTCTVVLGHLVDESEAPKAMQNARVCLEGICGGKKLRVPRLSVVAYKDFNLCRCSLLHTFEV